MAKNDVSEWDETAANNSDVGGVNIAEGMSTGDVNDAMREMMAQLATEYATPQSIARGGTGADTAAGARTALGSWFQLIGNITITTPDAAEAFEVPTDFQTVYIEYTDFEPVTDNSFLRMRIGNGGVGGSFVATSTYTSQLSRVSNTAFTGAIATNTAWPIGVTTGNASANRRGFGNMWLYNFNSTAAMRGHGSFGGLDSSGTDVFDQSAFRTDSALTHNAFQVFSNTGSIQNLTMRIYGVRHS